MRDKHFWETLRCYIVLHIVKYLVAIFKSALPK